MNSKKWLSCFGALLCSAMLAQTPENLKNIFAPKVVAAAPSDAYVGLSKLPSGELRHYNYGEHPAHPDPCFLQSKDNGLTWKTVNLPKELPYADQYSPASGEFIRVFYANGGVYALRTEGGLDGGRTIVKIDNQAGIMNKPPIFIRGGKRVISGAHRMDRSGAFVYYSDDDGRSWKISQKVSVPLHQGGGVHQGIRWNHGAVEPTIVELKDGRLWMIIRTSQDRHYQSFSNDGGETWSEAVPSPFYGTITMPTLYRMGDGRLLFFWSNTTPLPEMGNSNGVWEDVFTNRDAVHVAISEDDGKTWKGMRELLLNGQRNASTFNARSDKSVHQVQAVEVSPGKILAAVGQDEACRKLLLFDVDWIYEKGRSCDFSNGLTDWSAQRYLKGIVGHCSYNREEMPLLVDHPDQAGKKALRIRYVKSDKYVQDNEGAVWNFPAAPDGELKVKLKLPHGSANVDLLVNDRWFNPTDTVARSQCLYAVALNRKDLKIKDDRWHELTLRWKKNEPVRIFVDGKRRGSLPMVGPTEHGASYLHFLGGHTPDETGILIESVASRNTAE